MWNTATGRGWRLAAVAATAVALAGGCAEGVVATPPIESRATVVLGMLGSGASLADAYHRDVVPVTITGDELRLTLPQAGFRVLHAR